MKSIYKRDGIKIIVGIFILSVIGTGCKKLVNVAPPITSITGASVYNNNATAISVLTGMYIDLSTGGDFVCGTEGLSLLCGLSGDNFQLYSGISTANYIAYYTNSLSINVGGYEFWEKIYPLVFTCNSAIEGLTNNSSLSPAVEQQLMGEAKFMRAFFFFYLVNLYGDVPMPLSTDYKVNSDLSKTPSAQVYVQIIADLKEAGDLLNANYVDGTLLNTTTQRVRPTKWAAEALLARVYLYTKDYSDAVAQADSVIGNSGLFSLDALNNTFLENSTEAIWQLQPVAASPTNTQDGLLFIIPSTGPSSSNPVYLSRSLLNSFEPNDQRRIDWVDSVKIGTDIFYFPFKYKINASNAPVNEYEMVLRLGEQYLIRAEAEANLGDSKDAINDLDTIRGKPTQIDPLSPN